MKLGYSAWSMPRLPVDEQIRIVAEHGFQGTELIVIPGSSTDLDTLDQPERRRIRRLLDGSGLTLTSIAGYAGISDPDPERRAASLARVKATIDLAVDWAGPAGPPPVAVMGGERPEAWERVRDALAERFGELAEHARSRGVVVALEPHVGQAVDHPDRAVWLLERVGSPHFRLNFDISHFDVMGLHIDESVPKLAPYAVHTHLKDQRGRYPHFEFLIPGEGDFDYAAYLRAMHEAGYTGFITVEISVMVQRRPGYDPVAAARLSHETLSRAAADAGLSLAGG
ncbi:MAG: sugar phosphate isomerase/epimerase [Chloroflexi bacterium]|nr:sugar phosphate isomerase/epimerase [Chloroflexota bacterium]